MQMLHLHLEVQYNLSHVSSISVLSSSSPVDLMVVEQCCFGVSSSTHSSAAAETTTSGPYQPDILEPELTMNPMTTSNTSPGGEESKEANGNLLCLMK